MRLVGLGESWFIFPNKKSTPGMNQGAEKKKKINEKKLRFIRTKGRATFWKIER